MSPRCGWRLASLPSVEQPIKQQRHTFYTCSTRTIDHQPAATALSRRLWARFNGHPSTFLLCIPFFLSWCSKYRIRPFSVIVPVHRRCVMMAVEGGSLEPKRTRRISPSVIKMNSWLFSTGTVLVRVKMYCLFSLPLQRSASPRDTRATPDPHPIFHRNEID